MDSIWHKTDREGVMSDGRDAGRRRGAAARWTGARRACVLSILMTLVFVGAAARGGENGPSDGISGTDTPGESAPPVASEAPTDEPQRQTIHVDANDRVTMHVAGIPLSDALRMLSEPTKRNIIMADGAGGTVTASMYDATFEEALSAMLLSNSLGYRVDGDFIFVYPLGELAKMADAQRKIATRVFRLAYLNVTAAQDLIKPLLSNAGKVAVTPASSIGLGGENGIGDTEGNALATEDTLVVTDYVEKLDEVEALLRELDERPKQVLIEATVLRAALNEDNALGIDFTTVGGIDFGTLSSTSPAVQSITTGATPPGLLGDTTFTVRSNLNGAMPGGGFTFGILKDQIGVFIRALEQITDTSILANPKILALNKQVGQVIVGQRDGYFVTTVTETSMVQTVEFLETGTILTFRPFIGNDGYVRMEVHPKDSSGGVNDRDLPFETTTEVTTNVMVRDGHTILIGGLFREVSTATRGQTPMLGNIPVIGAMFRRTRDVTVREEVIILLTVHIIKGKPDERAGSALKEDVERFRVGTRRGLQWLGRERLGQAHYRWALEHMGRGDLEKSLWDVEMALHNSPRHMHAIKLKEELLGRRSWESESRSVYTYVMDRIAEENGIEEPHFGRPAPPFDIPEDINGPTGVEE